MKASGSQKFNSPVPDVVNGVSTDEKEDVTVDPRWPLLNRWSSQKASRFSTVEIPPFVPKPVGVSRQPLVSDQSSAHLIEDEVMVGEKINSETELSSEDTHIMNPSTFSSSLGAWKKPISMLSAPPHQVTKTTFQPNYSDWLALSRGNNSGIKNCDKQSTLVNDVGNVDGQLEVQQASLQAHSKDYPWAARMNQSMRNLHRVTIPEYMEDNTPKVRIPSHVLLSGLENQKEFVIGQFYRCLAPTGGQIQAVVTRIWGRKCRIFTRKLGDSTYLFHIPDESTRKWVIQRGLWHVDDCLLFVSPWSPTDTISIPEITTVPVWLTLINIPDQLYSILGIKWIASGIGEPLLTDKPWLDPTQMGKAKILVEVKLDKPFPKRVALIDKTDSITMVDVLYSWLPSTCTICGQLGHKVSRCLLLSAHTSPPLMSSDAHKIITTSGDATASKNETSASPKVDAAQDSHSSRINSGKHLVNETLERVDQAPTFVSPISMEATISTPQAATSFKSPAATASLPVTTRNSTITNPAIKAHLNEDANSNHVNPPSGNEDVALRRSLSTLALSTNMFASLDSSDDDDSDDDIDIPVLTNAPKPVEFPTQEERVLRERPVKQSEKAKTQHWQHVTGGRGNRRRGRRGGRG